MSSIANSLVAPAPAPQSANVTSTDALTSKDTFLKLLIAQIKNQDPTNPTDSTQFVGQLTQYSELEQLININKGVQNLQPAATNSTTPTPSK